MPSATFVEGAAAWDSYGILHRLTDDFTVWCGKAGCLVEIRSVLVGAEWRCPLCFHTREEER